MLFDIATCEFATIKFLLVVSKASSGRIITIVAGVMLSCFNLLFYRYPSLNKPLC